MTTTGQNFTVWQGEDKTITVALTNAAGLAYGSTTGLTFYWKVFASQDSSTALISKSSGSGITNGTSEISINLNSADTETQTATTYYHECRVIDGSGEEDVVFSGWMTLEASPTRTV